MLPQILKKILPAEIVQHADKLNLKELYEIRLRSERPISVNVRGIFYYLSNEGVTLSVAGAVKCSAREIKEVLIKATQYSLYAVNNQICEGYLTIAGGIRIGLAGETVWTDNALKTIKNFNALNIRLPHEVIGCGEKAVKHIYHNSQVLSSLFLSPPGAGKTTILRDTARILGSLNKIYNVLIVDERDEIAGMNDGKNELDIGINCDVINGCTKKFAFSRAIRALRPDIILTDELFGEQDVAAVEAAILSGVSVIATIHAKDQYDLLNKNGFESILKKRLFSRFFVLSDKHGPGTLDGVYDEKFNLVGG